MGRKKGSKLSDEHRRNISRAMVEQYAKYVLPLGLPKRKLSASHKKKIAAGIKASWRRRKQPATKETIE